MKRSASESVKNGYLKWALLSLLCVTHDVLGRCYKPNMCHPLAQIMSVPIYLKEISFNVGDFALLIED